MSTALEDLGMIGDGETVALVSRHGAIEWLCLPNFDSPACCAALLGTSEQGRWSIAPEAPVAHAEQRYEDDNLVLDTDLGSAAGLIRITDFMPMREGASPVLVRIVTGLSGSVPTLLDAAFRFDYGQLAPWVTRIAGGVVMQVGPDKIVLRGPGDFAIENGRVTLRFVAEEGSRHVFVLRYGTSHEPDPPAVDAEQALVGTQQYWRERMARFDRPIEHAEAVRRSLLTLKALINRPTGGLIAAPTTSLPEMPGGALNWDYRYCWLRDATFTLDAFTECGYLDEATAWRDWLLRAVGGAPDQMRIVYRVDGSRRLDEAVLSWLPGYRYASPVRIGNAAAAQFQLDVYGEVVRALHASEEAGMERTEPGRHLERAIVAHVERVWVEPDQGLWESRGEARHYTYSKVMAWVALHRFLDGEGKNEVTDQERQRLEALREHMHEVICREGFDVGLGSFTSYFGGQQVDASLLMLPVVGFLPATDDRMAGTIGLIEKTLVHDGLVQRHRSNDLVTEGAFLACSFWLAECQLLQGRRADAVTTIERVLALRSGLGLLSEEYDCASKRLTGNFPQALSHLALIHAVLALYEFDRRADEAGA